MVEFPIHEFSFQNDFYCCHCGIAMEKAAQGDIQCIRSSKVVAISHIIAQRKKQLIYVSIAPLIQKTLMEERTNESKTPD